MIRAIFILFLCAVSANAWNDAFEEQYHILGSNVCVKHYNRAYTSYGLNYRLDRDGQYIFKDDGVEPIKKRVNGPPRSMLDCAKLCRDNSKCVAFAHRSRDNLCQFMAHCEMTNVVNFDFRYFTKKSFGCHELDHSPGQTCKGMHSLEINSPTLVEECLEKATELKAEAFSVDADMNCRLWDQCNETKFQYKSTLYFTPN